MSAYGQPGSNGLTLDAQGRLTIDEHGRHRVTRLEPDGTLTVLAERWSGKRLNSPNDLVYRSDGTLFFTDPPFGLPKFFDDPRRELAFSGVFALVAGKPKLLTQELVGPNGLAFSPDERFLYVTNWDVTKKVVMRYAVAADGTLSDGRVFFDMTNAAEDRDLALDGIKVDRAGNLYVSGPGGLWILDANGKHLGTVRGPRLAANFAWGDDGKTLYLTARSGLYRMPLLVEGIPALKGLGLALLLSLLAASAAAEVRIERVDARLDAVIPPGASAEVLASGFAWVEGPVWDAKTRSLSGASRC